ncbi:hypothetical protein HYY72_05435 [Candidatus Woesearchaeota archaeon]|nr:hypothetical protein [Candidatus Woesearchaeota archaeon]
MDLRNIQKSGNAYYIYLPSAWCRQNKLTNSSQVQLDTSSEGKLIVSPNVSDTREDSLVLNMPEKDRRIINKLIVASYLNPVKSFRIKLDNEISSPDILDHKKLLGGIELVEFGEKQISCESSVFVDDPDILLRTMIKKIINMLRIMSSESQDELISRYEEEIDRSNMLINKSAISSFMFRRHSKLKHIDMFYIVRVSIYLERMVDYLIELKGSRAFFSQLMALMKGLDGVLENIHFATVVPFVKDVLKIGKRQDATGIINNLNNISDVLMDWAVTNEIERRRK